MLPYWKDLDMGTLEEHIVAAITRVVDCLAYTCMLVSRSYTVTLVSIVCLGAATPGRLMVGIPYLNEWFP